MIGQLLLLVARDVHVLAVVARAEVERGGRVVGRYPDDLSPEGDQILHRGRVVPTTAWEHVYSAVGEWFGVPADAMDAVLPNRGNFPAEEMFAAGDLFDI